MEPAEVKSSFKTGVQLFWDSKDYLSKNKLWGFTILPFLSSVMLCVLLFYGISQATGALEELTNLESHVGGFWSSLLSSVVNAIFFFFAYLYLFPLIVMIVFKLPLIGLGSLSEKIEKIEKNTEHAFDFGKEVTWLVSGLYLTFRDFLFKTILILLAGWIPLLGQLITVLNPVDWYYEGKGWMDLTAERNMNTLAQRSFLYKKNKTLLIGIGMSYKMTYLIPFMGLFLGPLFAVCASSRAFFMLNHD